MKKDWIGLHKKAPSVLPERAFHVAVHRADALSCTALVTPYAIGTPVKLGLYTLLTLLGAKVKVKMNKTQQGVCTIAVES